MDEPGTFMSVPASLATFLGCFAMLAASLYLALRGDRSRHDRE